MNVLKHFLAILVILFFISCAPPTDAELIMGTWSLTNHEIYTEISYALPNGEEEVTYIEGIGSLYDRNWTFDESIISFDGSFVVILEGNNGVEDFVLVNTVESIVKSSYTFSDDRIYVDGSNAKQIYEIDELTDSNLKITRPVNETREIDGVEQLWTGFVKYEFVR